jgi:hypothetical protein
MKAKRSAAMLARLKDSSFSLPAVLGGGILGVAFIGLGATLINQPVSVLGEAAAAVGGMLATILLIKRA